MIEFPRISKISKFPSLIETLYSEKLIVYKNENEMFELVLEIWKFWKLLEIIRSFR